MTRREFPLFISTVNFRSFIYRKRFFYRMDTKKNVLWKLYCWNNTARLLTKFYVEFMPSASDSFVRHQSAAFDHFRVIFTHNSLSRILLESRQYSKKLHERYNLSTILTTPFPAGIYQLKVINRNIRKRCEICSKLTIKTPERRHLVFLLLAWNM